MPTEKSSERAGAPPPVYAEKTICGTQNEYRTNTSTSGLQNKKHYDIISINKTKVPSFALSAHRV